MWFPQPCQIFNFSWIKLICLFYLLPVVLLASIKIKSTPDSRMLHAILNKSWQQHPTRHQLYGHLPPITKTIQVRRTRHAGHCWRSRDELIRDVLLWIPTHGRAKAGRPARTYIQQLCEDTGCCPEDLPRAMNDREEWRERVRDIRATSAIWWWWWWWWSSSYPMTPMTKQVQCYTLHKTFFLITWYHLMMPVNRSSCCLSWLATGATLWPASNSSNTHQNYYMTSYRWKMK